MKKIIQSILIKSPPDNTYNIAKKVEKYPNYMKDVKKIEVVKTAESCCRIRWKIDFDGVPLEWEEIVTYNDGRRKINFKMTKGDFYSYKGWWKIKNNSNGSEVEITAFVGWGVPKFEQYVANILERKTKKAIFGMLKCLKKEIEGMEKKSV